MYSKPCRPILLASDQGTSGSEAVTGTDKIEVVSFLIDALLQSAKSMFFTRSVIFVAIDCYWTERQRRNIRERVSRSVSKDANRANC